jgi:hypothetical protein
MDATSGAARTALIVIRLTVEEQGAAPMATIMEVGDVTADEQLWRRSADVDEVCGFVRAFVEDFFRRDG